MRKLLSAFLVVFILFFNCLISEAAELQKAIDNVSRKPAIILLYADWAPGYTTAIKNFRLAKRELKDKYNFVELNIADPEARYFNSRYYILTGLPYIFMIRGNGRVTKQIRSDCLSTKSCIVDRLKTFAP